MLSTWDNFEIEATRLNESRARAESMIYARR